ncbi:GrpB family protein [Paenibacillus beijingensis]|uniref:GrpB family protein n=1 Tax=Paenibacillus beijingensis TaxID=1126833 RepID=A0A0D5NMJ4_9BACL|nr:GrpB family protein [Paenibacillus beijingensis]AJY76202.1 hypothetical protein VN24_18580 [Paenibacillus beijingensis]
MKDPVIIEPYNEEWPAIFFELGKRIKEAIGDHAIRVDHIGSTAVPGLAAKPVIDVQISIRDINHFDLVKDGLETIGFRYIQDNPDRTKRYFREQPGMRRTHIHVREHGSWAEQFNLLFRDYLRTHEKEREEYADLKKKLSLIFRNQREQYVEGKTELIWNIMMKASKWSQEIGWKPDKADF